MTSADNQQATPPVVGESSETKRQEPKVRISKNLAIILGLLYTDGCVSPRKESFRIFLRSKSRNLTVYLKWALIEEFRLRPERINLRLRDNLWQIALTSREVGNFLIKTFGTFRTLAYGIEETTAHLPVLDLIANNVTRDFLRAAFSGDGGVCFFKTKAGSLFRSVFLASHHSQLRKDYVCLLNNLGISCHDYPSDNKVVIRGQHNIEVFREKVGFLKGTTVTSHSKNWDGYTKQQVLSFIVDSYTYPKRYFRL